MKVLIFDTREDATAHAAGMIAAQLAATPSLVLGLATGATMEPVYDRLVALCAQGLSFARATTFNLDEYVGLAPDHPASYHSYMTARFFSRIDIDPAQAHLPRGDGVHPAAAAAAYEEAIRAAGGIDLQLLGIGRNGHIGFNEPVSSLASRTRVTALSRSTREANRRHFPPGEGPPAAAITMGIATILEARQCLLLATGRAKAAPVAAMIEGPLAAICPASALQLHPDATILLDRYAAGDLRRQGDYLDCDTAAPGA